MFKKATRKQAKLKLALTGPSGAGKTMSALRLATGIGGKIAVIDTENGSASLYANEFDFDVCEIHPPYTVDAYEKAIHAAENAGYDIIIIDSISHQWKGEGGILNKKEQLDARGGDSFRNWGKLTPEQDRFNSAILHSPVHVISTLRAKQEYAMVAGDNGKHKIQKLGLAPIQRDGFEYEFTVVFDIAMNHEAEASKDRTNLFDGKFFKITEETGKQLKAWLDSGEKAEPVPRRQTPPVPQAEANPNSEKLVTEPQVKRLYAIQKNSKWSEDHVKFYMSDKFGIDSSRKLNWIQYDTLVKAIQTQQPPELPKSDEPPEVNSNEDFPA